MMFGGLYLVCGKPLVEQFTHDHDVIKYFMKLAPLTALLQLLDHSQQVE